MVKGARHIHAHNSLIDPHAHSSPVHIGNMSLNKRSVGLMYMYISAKKKKNLPFSILTASDLQVCLSRDVTCCTRKVEEQYQTAVRQDIQNLLQTFSYNLKLLITQNIATLQGEWDQTRSEPFVNLALGLICACLFIWAEIVRSICGWFNLVVWGSQWIRPDCGRLNWSVGLFESGLLRLAQIDQKCPP